MSNLNLKDTLFELPSQGKYDLGEALIDGSYVRIRPLLKGDQKVISAPGSNSYQVMRSLLDRVVVAPKLDLDNMLLSDAVAILFAVRLMSFGAQYQVRYQCEHCNEFNSVGLDLQQTEVRYANELEEFTPTGNEITLSDGTVIRYHLPTLGDEKKIAAQVKNLAKKGDNSNPNYMSNLVRMAMLCDHVARVGDDPESEPSLSQRMRYFDEEMTMADEKKVWDSLYQNDVGLVPESEHVCPSCGYENTIGLNIDANFFRSTDSK